MIDATCFKLDSLLMTGALLEDHSDGHQPRNCHVAGIADALKRRGRISIHVQGSSMLPLLHPGDIALIRKEAPGNMRAGDMVLMRQGAHLVAGWVGTDGKSFTERSLGETGDANLIGTAHDREWLGKIVCVYRKPEKIEPTPGKYSVLALCEKVFRINLRRFWL